MRSEDINGIREEDQKKLDKIKSVAHEIVGARVGAIQRKGEELENKLQDLIDKKGELFRSPISKAEVLEMAKEALREGKKKWFFDGILVPHLKNVQIQRATILSPEDFRVYSFSIESAWKLGYCVITEDDLVRAVGTLPDIGLASAERDAQIKKIDMEIAALEGQIKRELEKL